MDSFIKVPQDLKARLLLWEDISYHDMDLIEQMQSVPDLERALCSLLCVGLPEPKKEVLLELYVQTVFFCREHNLNKEQTSTLLSIIKSIHEANIETPLDNSNQCLRYCNDLLLCHSVRRPPFSINLFSFEEANCILKYIQDCYLRHYKLYKYIFTPQVKLDLFITYYGTPDMEPSLKKGSLCASKGSLLRLFINLEIPERKTLQVPTFEFWMCKETVLQHPAQGSLERSGSRRCSDNGTSTTELIFPNPSR